MSDGYEIKPTGEQHVWIDDTEYVLRLPRIGEFRKLRTKLFEITNTIAAQANEARERAEARAESAAEQAPPIVTAFPDPAVVEPLDAPVVPVEPAPGVEPEPIPVDKPTDLEAAVLAAMNETGGVDVDAVAAAMPAPEPEPSPPAEPEREPTVGETAAKLMDERLALSDAEEDLMHGWWCDVFAMLEKQGRAMVPLDSTPLWMVGLQPVADDAPAGTRPTSFAQIVVRAWRTRPTAPGGR